MTKRQLVWWWRSGVVLGLVILVAGAASGLDGEIIGVGALIVVASIYMGWWGVERIVEAGERRRERDDS